MRARLLVTLGLALTACPSSSPPGDGPAGAAPTASPAAADGAAGSAAAPDPAAERARLAGRWLVGPDAATPWFELTVAGDAVTVVDSRFGEARTTRGALVLDRPDELGLRREDGITYRYAYAFVGDTLHFGLGVARRVPDLARFDVSLGPTTRLSRDRDGCHFEGDVASPGPRAVPCHVEARAGVETLVYEAPDPFAPRKTVARALTWVGGYLLDDALLRGVARRAAP